MKKIVFGLIAFSIIIFSSCKNDEIKIDKPIAPVVNGLTMSVDISKFFSSYNYDDTYHNLGKGNQIAEAFRTFNSESGKLIQVRTLIYNKSTNEIVDSIVNYVSNLNQVTSTKDLLPGDYWAITTLAFADKADPNETWWYVADYKNLTTAKLYPRNRFSKWSILSSSTESFSVSRTQPAHVNTSPAPLGALTYIFCQNFQYLNEASYGIVADNKVREIALYTKRKAESYNLDPNATSKYNYFKETGVSEWYDNCYFEPSNFVVDGNRWTYFMTNIYGYCYILETEQTTCFGYALDGETSFRGPYGEQNNTFQAGTTYLAYWDYFQIGAPYFGVADNNHWHYYIAKTRSASTIESELTNDKFVVGKN